MPQIPWTTYEERVRLTAEAMDDVRVGDHFHEQYSFHVFVVGRGDSGKIAVLSASPPCAFPQDGQLWRGTPEEFRARFSPFVPPGEAGPHYSVLLYERDADVEGWLAAASEREPQS